MYWQRYTYKQTNSGKRERIHGKNYIFVLGKMGTRLMWKMHEIIIESTVTSSINGSQLWKLLLLNIIVKDNQGNLYSQNRISTQPLANYQLFLLVVFSNTSNILLFIYYFFKLLSLLFLVFLLHNIKICVLYAKC